jgi:hypothetical protein
VTALPPKQWTLVAEFEKENYGSGRGSEKTAIGAASR